MRRYSTEVHIPADRHILVQLPDGLPEGRAIVVIQTLEAEADAALHDDDREDIEWWEEFDDPVEDPAGRAS